MSDLTFDLTRVLPPFSDVPSDVPGDVPGTVPSSAMSDRLAFAASPARVVDEERTVRSDAKLQLHRPRPCSAETYWGRCGKAALASAPRKPH